MTELRIARRGRWARAPGERGPRETPASPAPSPRTGQDRKPGWDGPTYYGRAQLKPAPFNNWVVGVYIFLAGMAGSCSLLSGLAELVGGRRFEGVGRRGRYLAVLAPVLGAPLLIWDLHTPKRFYNMLRVVKGRSPMSIGTWILSVFSLGALPAAMAQAVGDLFGLGWLKSVARLAHAPAAAAGAGLSVYTAPLLSATSTPTWAAAPRAMAVRFGASSVASASAALLLGERDSAVRRALGTLVATALATEFAATTVQDAALKRTGVDQAKHTAWGRAETLLATGLGVIAPLALLGLSLATRGRRRALVDAAAVATLAGAAMMRVSVMGVGDESASRPEISFRFSQPENLPVVA